MLRIRGYGKGCQNTENRELNQLLFSRHIFQDVQDVPKKISVSIVCFIKRSCVWWNHQLRNHVHVYVTRVTSHLVVRESSSSTRSSNMKHTSSNTSYTSAAVNARICFCETEIQSKQGLSHGKITLNLQIEEILPRFTFDAERRIGHVYFDFNSRDLCFDVNS